MKTHGNALQIPSFRRKIYSSGVKTIGHPTISSLHAQLNLDSLTDPYPKLRKVVVRLKGYSVEYEDEDSWIEYEATTLAILTLSGPPLSRNISVSLRIDKPDTHGRLDVLEMLERKQRLVCDLSDEEFDGWEEYRKNAYYHPVNQPLDMKLQKVVFGECDMMARRREYEEVGNVTLESAFLKPIFARKTIFSHLTYLDGGNAPVSFQSLVSALEYLPNIKTLNILVLESTSQAEFLTLVHLLPKIVNLKFWDERSYLSLDLLGLLETLTKFCPNLKTIDIPFDIDSTGRKLKREIDGYDGYRKRPSSDVQPRFNLTKVSLLTDPDDLHEMTILSFVYLIIHLFGSKAKFSISLFKELEDEDEDYYDVEQAEEEWNFKARNEKMRCWKNEVETTLKVVKEEIFGEGK